MDLTPETYALVVPEGVVTYSLHRVYDNQVQRLGTYPAGALLHPVGHEASMPLGTDEIEQYIANYGRGRLLHAHL